MTTNVLQPAHYQRLQTRQAAWHWIPIHSQLRLYWQRYRQRRTLARLDDHLLRDIGVSRAAALREAEKPFWQS